jgi:hypothetical protein
LDSTGQSTAFGNALGNAITENSYSKRPSSPKAAIKLHTLLDLRGCIPSFIHISDGKMGDVNVLDILALEAGAFYIMDRGYLDFARLYTMHQAGAFFVTRAKSNFNARWVYSAEVDKAMGVVCDQAVALNGFKAVRDYPEHLRRWSCSSNGSSSICASSGFWATARTP